MQRHVAWLADSHSCKAGWSSHAITINTVLSSIGLLINQGQCHEPACWLVCFAMGTTSAC